MTHPVDHLFAVIRSRAGSDPSASYTSKLLAAGVPQIAKKLGEEAVETVIAAVSQDNEAIARESADLIYHLLVLWESVGLGPDDIYAILRMRSGKSGLEEKASRGSGSV